MTRTAAPIRSVLGLAGFFVLAVSAITLLMVIGGLTWANGRGSAADHTIALLITGIGLAIFAPVAVTAVVQLFRVLAGSPTAHLALARCAVTVGSFVLVVAVPIMQRGTVLGVAVVVGFAGIFSGIGAAVRRLLAPAAR